LLLLLFLLLILLALGLLLGVLLLLLLFLFRLRLWLLLRMLLLLLCFLFRLRLRLWLLLRMLLLLLFWLGFLLRLIGWFFLGFLLRLGRLFLLLGFLFLALASESRHATSQEQGDCCRTDYSDRFHTFFLHDRNLLRAFWCPAGALAFAATKSHPGSRPGGGRSPLLPMCRCGFERGCERARTCPGATTRRL
jgi:hypothetical protein